MALTRPSTLRVLKPELAYQDERFLALVEARLVTAALLGKEEVTLHFDTCAPLTTAEAYTGYWESEGFLQEEGFTVGEVHAGDGALIGITISW